MDGRKLPDTWAVGDGYEPYVGRWSRVVARGFLEWVAIPEGGRWLDVGCGTGALTSVILERCAPAEVIGIDSSAGFVAYARAHIDDARVRFEVADAQALPPGVADRDAAVSGLVLNFVPEPIRAVREMARVVRTGGTVAAYVWDYAGGMAMMRHFWAAAADIDPASRDLDEGQRFNTVCSPDGLTVLFEEAGLERVAAREITVPTVFRDFDDYWTPFLGGQGVAPAYAMRIPPDRRDAIRDRLRAALPVAPDGSIALTARAWAVRGFRA